MYHAYLRIVSAHQGGTGHTRPAGPLTSVGNSAGAVLIAVSALVFTQAGTDTGEVGLAAAIFVTGLGLGFVGAPTMGRCTGRCHRSRCRRGRPAVRAQPAGRARAAGEQTRHDGLTPGSGTVGHPAVAELFRHHAPVRRRRGSE